MEVGRPNIGGAAENENPLFLVLDEGLDRVVAQIWVHGSGIEAEGFKERFSICASGVTDIAPFGITDDRDRLRNVSHRLLQRLKPLNSHSFVKGKIGFVSTHQIAGGVYDALVELNHAHTRHQLRVRIQPDAKKALVGAGGG